MVKVSRTFIVLSVIWVFGLVALSPADTGESQVSKAEGEKADAFAANRLIGRGVNFGNALEAPAEGEWGVTLKEQYFDLAKEAGFDSIRLPVRWNAHAMEEPPYTIDAEFFKRVDWAVDNALARDLPVMLNIHHYNELDDDPVGHKERFIKCARKPTSLLVGRMAPLKAGVFRGRQSPNNRLQSNPTRVSIPPGGFDYDSNIRCSLQIRA